MRDSLDRSISAPGLLIRLVLGVALLALVPPVACVGVHHLRHPAPLGRSAKEIGAHLDADLPMGTSVDSARRYLEAHGAEVSLYDVAEASRTFANDASWTHGAVLVARLPSVNRDFHEWDAVITVYFTPSGGLVRHDTVLDAVNPL